MNASQTTVAEPTEPSTPLTDHPARTGLRATAHDVVPVFLREILLILRDPFSLVFSLLQPLIFLGLFGPLLAGSVGDALPGGTALQWFLPGVVVMIALFGTSMTGANLQYEMQTGAYERILASPLSRPSILVGRALKEFTPLVAQAVVIVLVCLPFGFRLHPAHVLVGLLVLGVFGIGLGALSYALAIATRKAEWMFWTVQQSLLFPLLILSGMMLPLEAGPGWMQTVARFNPLTYIVEAERALFSGTFADPAVGWGALAAVVTCAVGIAVGVRALSSTAR